MISPVLLSLAGL
jgi:hypothetical protein